MLLKPSKILNSCIQQAAENSSVQESVSLITGDTDSVFVDKQQIALTKAIGTLTAGKTTHYYSYGNFNLVRLMMYLIKQTGPVNAFMTSYSFSPKSIDAILNQIHNKNLLSFKLIIDNRVRSLSPLPFQMIMESFDYKCTSIHAKVALLWNQDWKISIVTSQNATDNPKMERGTIFTDEAVFNFDFNALTNEYNRGNL